MNQAQMLQEAMRLLSDPKTMSAIQAATAPLVEKLQQSKVNLQSGKDPITSLFDILNSSEKAEEAVPEEELSVVHFQNSIGKVFVHSKTGNCYVLVMLTNEDSEDKDKFPVSVVYMNTSTKQTWSRPLAEFQQKFKLI